MLQCLSFSSSQFIKSNKQGNEWLCNVINTNGNMQRILQNFRRTVPTEPIKWNPATTISVVEHMSFVFTACFDAD